MGRRFAELTLFHKQLVAIVAGTLLALFVAGGAVLSYETTTFRPRAQAQLQAVGVVMADINQAPLDFSDSTLATENLAILRLYPGIVAGRLFRTDGSMFAQWTGVSHAGAPEQAPQAGFSSADGYLHLTTPVMRDGRQLGLLWLRMRLPPLIERLPQYSIMMGALALAVTVLGGVILYASRVLVTQPLARLGHTAREVGRTRNYSVRVSRESADEIGQMTEEFNRMLALIGERDEALQAAHDGLERRVEERGKELEQAIAKLMQSEKLAALGNVVAGVAHELNTPIGNALLAATNLGMESRRMLGQIGGTTLSRRELQEFVRSVEEGSSIVTVSLNRAARLVRSFKSVAVNETSEARMTFDLRVVLEDSISLLAPSLKQLPVQLSLDCPSGIKCDSYPGALAQVVTNLVENAARHGLEPKGAGSISVEASTQAGWVTLRVRDDGVGIPSENLTRIFEPFFTTRLGRGGSGLGLHLVHTLASTPLGGSVRAQSTVGSGSSFEVHFPQTAPGATSG